MASVIFLGVNNIIPYYVLIDTCAVMRFFRTLYSLLPCSSYVAFRSILSLE
uniref:Uncharacterized protein n=1 Tax=Arundo donax TaxID=35708 RepID=A0A0A8ZYA9_ARUDO